MLFAMQVVLKFVAPETLYKIYDMAGGERPVDKPIPTHGMMHIWLKNKQADDELNVPVILGSLREDEVCSPPPACHFLRRAAPSRDRSTAQGNRSADEHAAYRHLAPAHRHDGTRRSSEGTALMLSQKGWLAIQHVVKIASYVRVLPLLAKDWGCPHTARYDPDWVGILMDRAEQLMNGDVEFDVRPIVAEVVPLPELRMPADASTMRALLNKIMTERPSGVLAVRLEMLAPLLRVDELALASFLGGGPPPAGDFLAILAKVRTRERLFRFYYNYVVTIGHPDLVMARFDVLKLTPGQRLAFLDGGWMRSPLPTELVINALARFSDVPKRVLLLAEEEEPNPRRRRLARVAAAKRRLEDAEAAPDAKRRRHLTEAADLGLVEAPSAPVVDDTWQIGLAISNTAPNVAAESKDASAYFAALMGKETMDIISDEVIMASDDDTATIEYKTPPTVADDAMEVDAPGMHACHRCGSAAPVHDLESGKPFCEPCRCKGPNHYGMIKCKRDENEACCYNCLVDQWYQGTTHRKVKWIGPKGRCVPEM